MLHSTLPRAFLPPGISYLGGYYGDEGHVYSPSYVSTIEDPYARFASQRVHVASWEIGSRPVSPSPLDLSLKPPPLAASHPSTHLPIPSNPDDCEAIEVDDEDVGPSTAQRRALMSKRSYSNSEEFSPGVEEVRELRRSSSVHTYQGYPDIPLKGSIDPQCSLQRLQREEISRSPINPYLNYEEAKKVFDPMEYKSHQDIQCTINDLKNHQTIAEQQKLLASPNKLETSNYHQQSLMTPQHHLQGMNAPMTPPSTPSPPQCTRRRTREELELTPPQGSASVTPKSSNSEKLSRPKKKHARRLKFDEDTSSPVSGTVILGPDEAVVTGDIDPAFNIVEVTEEARAELAKIENRLGPYQCKLCRQLHEDAFQLAQHRCSRIAHVEYRCPECDKRFSCPANLASHRRWHKPRMQSGENLPTGSNSNTEAREMSCTRCDVKFTRAAALRKHLATQHPETNNNVSMANNNENNSNFEELVLPGKPLCVPIPTNLGNPSLTNEIA